jgi:hypothetical protein
VPNDRYEGRLHVYDRADGRSFPNSPHKAARERDFYSVEVEGESPALAEDAYATLEARFAPTIASVNERGTLPIDPIAMREVLAFVASQATRTPRVREVQAKTYSDAEFLVMQTLADNKTAFMNELRKFKPGITNDEAEAMYAEHCEYVNGDGPRDEVDQTRLVRDALELAGDLEDVLARRWWILGRPHDDDVRFITSDDPVHLQWAARRPTVPPMWSPGFGDGDTTVMVPLNPRLMLIGLSYRHDRARVRFTRQQVAALNTDLALAARRFVYSTEPTFAQVNEAGTVVGGPTEVLRRREPPRSPLGGFPGTA